MSSITNFDPNLPGLISNNIFGLPYSEEESAVVLIPVPWEVTVSYRTGAAYGPAAIMEASLQVDLYDTDVPDAWKRGIFMRDEEATIAEMNEDLREHTEFLLEAMQNGESIHEERELVKSLLQVNTGCAVMCDWVHDTTQALLQAGKKVGLVGGDHSTPLGYLQALAEVHDSFGILQIDAHADLREAYEGFTHSHASIMYNVITTLPQVSRLVQLGIRDYCDAEAAMTAASDGRIVTFLDSDIKARQYEGATWRSICNDVVAALPEKLYISFDIDGLDPKLCPGTGTPVPGGFELEQIFYLLRLIHASGKKLIGFDLNEVSGINYEDTIDAITGARALYKLCGYLALQA